MAIKKIISRSPIQTFNFGRFCASRVRKSAVFALRGELGSGKTTFVKGAAKELGAKAETVSPTFALLKQYRFSKNRQKWTLYHFDLYRLKNSVEFFNEGFGEVFKEPNSIIVIEWPERIADILPKKRIDISFSHGDLSKIRIIKMKEL